MDWFLIVRHPVQQMAPRYPQLPYVNDIIAMYCSFADMSTRRLPRHSNDLPLDLLDRRHTGYGPMDSLP
jgi:hypothetical protein